MKEIKEHSYSYLDGFLLADPRMIDWEKVRELLASNKYTEIQVGLAEDWACTYASIYSDGKRQIKENDLGFCGASMWATPAVKLISANGKSKLYECWVDGNNYELLDCGF